MRIRNFIFGYGSLICPDSRARTAPALGIQTGLPVLIRNYERIWSARVSLSGFTAMGVCQKEGSSCSGVILEVTDEELEHFDVRERGYDRVAVPLEDIDKIEALQLDGYYAAGQTQIHAIIRAKEEGAPEKGETIKVWIYVQKEYLGSDESHPIPQSYVDIIMRGCLTISDDFARSFIDTTAGWYNPESINWVDDRRNPIYVRADPQFSEENSERIDTLLKEQEPNGFSRRVAYNPRTHLKALERALVSNMALSQGLDRIQSLC